MLVSLSLFLVVIVVVIYLIIIIIITTKGILSRELIRNQSYSEAKGGNVSVDTDSKSEGKNENGNNSGAVLLSISDTPDFLLLPLEFQGYCPWTIVEARGLLIPG